MLNQPDADSILVYDNLLRIYTKGETTSFQEIQTNIRNVIFDLGNYEVKTQLNNNMAVPVQFSDNKALLNRYFNLLETYAINCDGNRQSLEMLKQKAIGLIEYFKHQYNLK